MNSPVDVDVLMKFAIRLSIIFVLIFLLALITPRLAKLVEGWIEKYKKRHDPDEDEDETYGIRSIYELPPRKRSRALKEEEEEYDLDAQDEELDGEDYSLDDEQEPAKTVQPEPEETEPAEPVYLFSFFGLKEKPYDLTLWKVKYKKAVPIDVGEQDFSGIRFGVPLPSGGYVTPGDDEDDDAESFIGDPLIPCDTEDDGFFDDCFFDGEPEEDEDGDTPWFMR